jgi:hypothetical protein
MRPLLNFIRFLAYHFYAKENLVTEVSGYLSPSELRFIPEFSGRTALVAVAEKIARRTQDRKALVPDYICDAVHKALGAVGFTTIPYATDSRCEPDARDLEAMVIRCEPAVILTASLFGSSAMLDWLSLAATRDFLTRRGVSVLVDLCQDVRLVKHLPKGYGEWLDAVVSFNDKSFPGIMGGGVITSGGIEAPRLDLSLTQTLLLYRHLGWKWARDWRRTGEKEPRGFDWSSCSPFPYGLERYHPHRLQLVMALLGLQQLDRYALRKQALLADHSERVLRTPFADTAPFVVFASEEAPPPTRKRKQPYATPFDPRTSLRPQQVIVHNKGFYDLRREARTSFFADKIRRRARRSGTGG